MGNRRQSDILSWIEQAIQQERFVTKEILLTGTTEKTDGYASDIVFAKVSGVDTGGNNKEVDLAIKMGKQNERLREQFSMMGDIYAREILAYERIFPAFSAFEKEKNIADGFDALPKCYATFSSDSAEVLVLENLRKKGFRLRFKNAPMNLQHIKLVLDSYAKFHALSFAFRDQKAEEYAALTYGYDRINIQMIEQFGDLFEKSAKKVEQNLIEASRKDLAEQYEKAVKSNSLMGILKEEVEHSVITHGDCHNNNFVFQYKDNDDENPIKVVILDWQVSTQHSPVMDLSYFLYAVAGQLIYKLPELLEYYHSNLSRHAKELGTDLSKIYPFASLVEDWRRYSYYAFVFITTFLEVLLVQKEDAPSLDVAEDGVNPMDQMFTYVNVGNRDEYFKRLIQIVDQFCNHQL